MIINRLTLFFKAFDRVPHNRLCNKLFFYGIRGPLLSWIKNYLSDRTQKVITDGISSNSSTVTSGLQGTVLAPLLFLCFVNDIPCLISSKIRLYADDILLYSIINSNEDCISLQNDIDKLLNWSRDWQLLFNYEKCEYLHNNYNKQNFTNYLNILYGYKHY